MSINRYAYSMEDEDISPDFTLTISVSDKVLVCRFLWAIASQEQYDLFVQANKDRAATDPLFNGNEYIRDYDWITYYYSLQDRDLEEWMNTSEYLPQSIRDSNNPLYTLNEYIQQASELYDQYVQFIETLRWQCTVSFEDQVVVTNVVPGGWTDYGMPVAIRFTAGARTYIGYEDLQYVTIEVDVYE